MPKMRLRPGLRPGPRCGSLQRSPDPLAGNGGGAPPGREGEREKTGREGKRRGGEGTGGEGREGKEREGKERGRLFPGNENPGGLGSAVSERPRDISCH